MDAANEANEPTVAWVDYLLSSREPEDHSLADNLLALNWAYNETLAWTKRQIDVSELTSEALVKLTKQAALVEVAQGRVHRRATELKAAGVKPADHATAMAWRAKLATLCPITQLEDNQLPYRA